MSPEMELVQEWLECARDDVRTAELALQGDPPVCTTACFHSQQAVEKALKAFLIWQDIDFEWSHEIAYLLGLCAARDSSFQRWCASAEPLTDYAVWSRYPGESPDPTAQTARAALEVARGVYGFVLQRIPGEAHPSG